MGEAHLFTIEARGTKYDRAEAALQAVDCYLVPTATRGTHAVACGGVWAAHSDYQMRRAREALRAAGL